MLRFCLVIVLAATALPAWPRDVRAHGIPVGDWQVVEIEGVPVLKDTAVTLELKEDGAVSGNGGCNAFFGSATAADGPLRFGPLGATRRACGEAIDRQERLYFGALEGVRTWAVDGDRTVVLADAEGKVLVRLRAA